jgi:hypothetical protein
VLEGGAVDVDIIEKDVHYEHLWGSIAHLTNGVELVCGRVASITLCGCVCVCVCVCICLCVCACGLL